MNNDIAPPQSRFKLFFKRTVLLVGTLMFIFIVLEIGVRFIENTPSVIIEPDPFIARKTKPNIDMYLPADGGGEAHVKTNTYGFPGSVDWTLKKPSGTLRIAHLGDSFTAAQDVDFDKNYTVFVERDLEMLASTSVESLNFGVNGQGTGHQLATYEHYARQFTPDLVVVWFFYGNDFEDNLVHEEGAEGVANPDESIAKRIARKSRLAHFVVNRLAHVPVVATWMHGRVLNRVGDDRRGSDAGLPLTVRLLYTLDSEQENETARDQTRTYLQALSAAVDDDNAKLVVIMVPVHHQVQFLYEEKLKDQYPELRDSALAFDALRPNRELSTILDTLAIPYLDMTPVFANTCNNETESCSLYLCAHCHLSVPGHQKASELVAPFILEILMQKQYERD